MADLDLHINFSHCTRDSVIPLKASKVTPIQSEDVVSAGNEIREKSFISCSSLPEPSIEQEMCKEKNRTSPLNKTKIESATPSLKASVYWFTIQLLLISLFFTVSCDTDCIGAEGEIIGFSAKLIGPDLILDPVIKDKAEDQNNCTNSATWKSVIWEGGPKSMTLTNGNVSKDKKYKFKDPYGLVIQDFTEKDYKSKYKVHVGFTYKELYISNITVHPDPKTFKASFQLVDMVELIVMITFKSLAEPKFDFKLKNETVSFELYKVLRNKTSDYNSYQYIAKRKLSSPPCQETFVVNYQLFGFVGQLLNKNLDGGCEKSRNHTLVYIATVCVVSAIVVMGIIVGCIMKRRNGSRTQTGVENDFSSESVSHNESGGRLLEMTEDTP